MAKHENYITLGQLIDAGTVEITLGFPCGSHNSDGEGIPHIRPFNIQPNGKISLEQIKSIPLDLASGKPTLSQGDIVFNNTNTKELVGKCAVWEGNQEFVFSNHMTRIRLHDKQINNEYLNFAILHHWITGKSEMLARSHVAQASIIGERFREILLPWRTKNEQTLIANLLAQTHRAISFQEKQIKNTFELKNTVMLELFTRGLRNEEQSHTEIGLVPKSWTVNELCHYIGKPDYGFTASANQTNVGPKFLRITDIQEGNVNWNTVPYCVCNKNNLSEKKLMPNDIVIARIGATTGKAFLIESCPEAIFASYLIRIRTNEKILLPQFLYYFMQSGSYWIQIEKQKGGRLKGGINIPVLSSLCVPIPIQDEQYEIAKILKTIDKKIDLHKKKQAVLEDLFKTLLHNLMTGETHVSKFDLSALEKSAATVGAFA